MIYSQHEVCVDQYSYEKSHFGSHQFAMEPQRHVSLSGTLDKMVELIAAIDTYGLLYRMRGNTLKIFNCVTQEFKSYCKPTLHQYAFGEEIVLMSDRSIFLTGGHLKETNKKIGY